MILRVMVMPQTQKSGQAPAPAFSGPPVNSSAAPSPNPLRRLPRSQSISRAVVVLECIQFFLQHLRESLDVDGRNTHGLNGVFGAFALAHDHENRFAERMSVCEPERVGCAHRFK